MYGKHFYLKRTTYCRLALFTSPIRSMSVQSSVWVQPAKEVEEPVLKIYNSFTKSKAGIFTTESFDISSDNKSSA